MPCRMMLAIPQTLAMWNQSSCTGRMGGARCELLHVQVAAIAGVHASQYLCAEYVRIYPPVTISSVCMQADEPNWTCPCTLVRLDLLLYSAPGCCSAVHAAVATLY